MLCHPDIREALNGDSINLCDVSPEEKRALRIVLAIMRHYNLQYGNLSATFMAGKAIKFSWTDTISIK